jgi:subtilisin family serine protease
MVPMLILVALLAQSGPFLEEAGLQQTGGAVKPEVWQTLTEGPETEVFISLKPPDQASTPPTLAEIQQNAAERQARVLADLAPGDFTVTLQYSSLAALAGRISASGAQQPATHPDVAAVDLNATVSGSLEESVPLIHAGEMHVQGITGAGVEVAVIDTGIDTDHPDLQESIIGEECTILNAEGEPDENWCRGIAAGHPAEDDTLFDQCCNHGSHVSGIITSDGDNGIAGPGVAPGGHLRLQGAHPLSEWRFHVHHRSGARSPGWSDHGRSTAGGPHRVRQHESW